MLGPKDKAHKTTAKKTIAHFNKVWPSSSELMNYISDIPQHPTGVLEIGCGWGGSSIMLAKHFKTCGTPCIIDVAVRPILGLHCQINKCATIFQKIDFRFLNNDLLNRYNMLIASDIYS